LVTDLDNGISQQAVLTARTGVNNQRLLLVLLPGTLGVLRLVSLQKAIKSSAKVIR